MARKKGDPHKAELKGIKFSRLLVKERIKGSKWLCICECGKEVIAQTHALKTGRVKSCGCYSREITTKHGMEGTPTYNTWAHMLSRCNNANHKQYADYGGRGITVCEEWRSFINFLTDMGNKPKGMSLDRINNDLGYYKENCRWTDQKQQIRNRRVSKIVEFQGRKVSLSELCEEKNINWRMVYERIRQGWVVEKAINTPSRKNKKHATSIQ